MAQLQCKQVPELLREKCVLLIMVRSHKWPGKNPPKNLVLTSIFNFLMCSELLDSIYVSGATIYYSTADW